MSLTTGKRLARRQWTTIPMPDAIIAAVKARALEEKQPLIEGGCPCFEWCPNVPLGNDAIIIPPLGNDAIIIPPFTVPQNHKAEADGLTILADMAQAADPLPWHDDALADAPDFGAQHPEHQAPQTEGDKETIVFIHEQDAAPMLSLLWCPAMSMSISNCQLLQMKSTCLMMNPDTVTCMNRLRA